MKELRKWAQPSDLTAMLELIADISKVKMKRIDDNEVLNSEDSGVSNDKKRIHGSFACCSTQRLFELN